MLDLPGIRSIGCATGVSSRACFADSHPANTSIVAEVSPTSVGSTARTVSDRPDRGRHPDELGHAPRLGDASPGRERFLGVEDLAHGADAGPPQMLVEPPHHGPGLAATVGAGPEPGVDERPP